MKVTQMKTTPLAVPRDNPSLNPTTGVVVSMTYPVLVELKTDEGLEGWGICFTHNPKQVSALKACVDDLEEVVIGQDVARFTEAWQKLWNASGHMGHQGYGIYAVAAIDSAMWMLRAKALNMPLAHCLGGFRDKVPSYASQSLWRNWTIDGLQKDAAAMVKQGFKAMKMRMGDKPYKVEVERYKAVREAVGPDINIMVDLNWSKTTTEAIQLGRLLDGQGVYWWEDPLASDDPEQIAQVAAALDMPVVVGETHSHKYGFRTLFEKKAADIVMIDLERVGGVTEWIRVANMASAFNIPVASHLFPDFSLHLVASIPNGVWMEYMPWFDKLYKEMYKIKDGYMEVPKSPGIGLELDPAAIKKYTMK